MSVKIEVRDSDSIFHAIKDAPSLTLVDIGGRILLEPLRCVCFLSDRGTSTVDAIDGYYTLEAKISFADQDIFDRFRVQSLLPLSSSDFYVLNLNNDQFAITDPGNRIEFIVRKNIDSQEKIILVSSNRPQTSNVIMPAKKITNPKDFYQEIIRFKLIVQLVINGIYEEIIGGLIQTISVPIFIQKKIEEKSEPAVDYGDSQSQECQPFRSKVTICQVCRNPTKRVLRLQEEKALICSFECEYKYYIAHLSIEPEAP